MTSKVNAGKFSCQYGYDLRNRLASANIARKEGLQDVTITSSYAYNTAGIRTRAEQTINGVTQNRYFLLDSGHTGYAQVFEETSTLGGNLVRSYVLGDDVLSQNVGGVTSHLLHDGHGSTRQLAGDDGAVTANYAYDAYGKMLGGNPGVTDGKQSATDLLYAGEQFDAGLQMEYLRARYYDQDNGRFNRLDPFDGNSEDPQSLHKYAYAHADPVNGIDPSGEMTILQLQITITISFAFTGMIAGAILNGVKGAIIGTLIGIITGVLIAHYFAIPIVYWASVMWESLGSLIHRIGAPTTRFITGQWGRVSIDALSKLEKTDAITLYSRLSGAVDPSRPLYTATTQALADGGMRAQRVLHIFKVPSGVLNQLESIGAVRITATQESIGRASGIAYEFTPEAAAYIIKFLQ